MAKPTRRAGVTGAISRHPAGVVGGLLGLAAAGAAAGVAVSRRGRGPAPELSEGLPGRELTEAEFLAEDPLGPRGRAADRTALVQADDGVLLAVEEIGLARAPVTIVFVHGYTLSMACWAFQRRALAGELTRARLVFYDQRGHGASGRGSSVNSTIEQLARDLSTVLDVRVPRGPVVLVGHSMGGMTIMGLAALQPELFGSRVVGVALMSTSSGNLANLTFGLPDLLTRVRAAVLPVAAWTMRRRPAIAEHTRRLAAGVVSAATRSLSFASSDVDPALAHYVDAMIAGTPVDVIAEFYPAIAGLDHTGSLEPLRGVPTLVLTGDEDTLIPKEHSERLVELLPDAELIVVPEAGHMVLLEKPAEVNAALGGLLDKVRATAAEDRAG
ncbi:MAG TPA: alpha/beta hydrolase [Blastococcus sp.]|nr:alpha/beta hydrolase [Blastococcus sp.]